MTAFLTSIPGIVCLAGLVLLIILGRMPRKDGSGDRMEPRMVMQIVVTGVVLLAGLYIVLSADYSGDTERWAFGVIGAVLGYWLPSPG